MIKDYLASNMQNKNFIMFITTIIYMAGITACFNDNGIAVSAVVSILALIALIKNIMKPKYILLCIAVFYFGFFNTYFRIPAADGLVPFAPADTSVTGHIVSIPNSNDKSKTKFFFRVDKLGEESVEGKTYITVSDEKGSFSNLNIGNKYKINVKLRVPFKVGNPSQFDYGKYLRNYNVFSTAYADSADIELVPSKLSLRWNFLQKLNDLRNKIIETHALYLKSPNLEILGGIVFGDDAVSPPDYIHNAFQNSGLLHILAASGMNVAFIYGFWYFFMRKLRVPFKLSVLSGMGIVILYTLMTGLGPSIIRAALMLLFVLAGKLIDRDSNSVSLLAFVAFLMLVYNPAYINSVGFQLSFIVTFGILTTANAIFERTYHSRIPNWLLSAVLIPAVAQIWVAPLQMYYFNSFSTYSILANIAIMPFLSVVSFGGFTGSILAIFSPYTKYLCAAIDFVMNYLLNVIVFIADFVSHLKYSLLMTSHPSFLQILMYYGIILMFTLMLKNGWDKKVFLYIGITALLLFLSTISIPDKKLDIITFDVQNADSLLIKTPQNNYFIIDSGKSSYNSKRSQAQYITLKYLRDRGIRNIEGLIITHFDNDHAGGAADIIKELKIKNVYLNSYNATTDTAENTYKEISKSKTPSQLAKNNDTIYTEKDLTIKTFYADVPKSEESENENSVITLLQYKDFDMLFMGDAGLAAFNKVKKDLPGNIEVLKVGHHGGRKVTDKSMLDYINNDISIISTGPNAFGHPNKGTLDILRDTEVLRTDINNSIKITTDGKKYKVYTFSKEKHGYIPFKEIISK